MLQTMTETELDTWVATMAERPAWEEFWAGVGSEDWLAAKALIELSGDLRAEAGSWLRYAEHEKWDDDGNTVGTYLQAEFDWPEWLADVDANGRPWSSTAARLFEVVAGVLDPDRKVPLYRALSYAGSWEADMWRILVEWGTGGNNRDQQGRFTVVPN